MVSSWRRYFHNPNAVFSYVELEPSDYMPANIKDFRTAQLATNKLSNVGFAIGTDIGDPLGPFGMVHPRNKALIGQRLAAAALTLSYGTPVAYLPPTYKLSTAAATATASGTTVTVTVTFENLPSVLVHAADYCKIELKVDARRCGWFSITGSDGHVLNATATIGTDRKSIVLTALAKSGVIAAASSFGWNAWPINTIVSAEGLPLQPWSQTVWGGHTHRGCVLDTVHGCYNDSAWSTVPYRILPLHQAQLHDKVTYESCASACAALNASYLAGIDGGNHCFCGALIAGAEALARPMVECEATACHANPKQKDCGGKNRMLVYNFSCLPVDLEL